MSLSLYTAEPRERRGRSDDMRPGAVIRHGGPEEWQVVGYDPREMLVHVRGRTSGVRRSIRATDLLMDGFTVST